MNPDEAKKILSKHFDEFPDDVKLAVEFMLKNLDTFCRKKMHDIWTGVKQRCFNPNNKSYKDYGERGITMHEPWINDFKAFYEYVSKLPHFGEEGYSLDRINNDGDYAPGNLRWADRGAQNRNKSTVVLVEYQGRTMCLKDASKESGLSYDTLRTRHERGQELFKPVAAAKPLPLIEYDGKLIMLKDAANVTGVKYNTIRHRYLKGARGEELFSSPHKGSRKKS